MEALILVDIQNDFLPGGALAVPEGNQIIPIVNQLQEKYELIVATQDFHPPHHKSFATNHPGKKPGEIITLNGLEQILWPVHCVRNSEGADFARELNKEKISKVFTKGTDPEIDSYSGFYDNGHLKATGLGDYLEKKKVKKVIIVGLAADYCVKYTALDAIAANLSAMVVEDATRAVNLQQGDFEKAMDQMRASGVQVLKSSKLLNT